MTELSSLSPGGALHYGGCTEVFESDGLSSNSSSVSCLLLMLSKLRNSARYPSLSFSFCRMKVEITAVVVRFPCGVCSVPTVCTCQLLRDYDYCGALSKEAHQQLLRLVELKTPCEGRSLGLSGLNRQFHFWHALVCRLDPQVDSFSSSGYHDQWPNTM